MATLEPPIPEGRRETESKILVAARLRPFEHRPQVRKIVLEPLKPFALTIAPQFRLGALGEVDEVLGAPPAELISFARLLQQFRRVLADRLEHPEAIFTTEAYETLIDERLKGVDIRRADLLRRVKRPAPVEDSKPGEELLLRLAEQFVAPLDRRAECLLPRIDSSARLEQIEAL